MEEQAEPTAALTIRLWVEGEPPGPRARITRTLDVTKADQVSTVTASRQEVSEIVEGWFESFLAATGVSTLPA